MSENSRVHDIGAAMTEFAVELTAAADEQRPGLGSSVTDVMRGASAQQDLENVIMDIPVTLKVVLGTARMPVAAVSKLTRGSVIKLDNKVGDPVDIYVNGRFIARGQVVVLDEGTSRFGVTLTQVGDAQSPRRQ